MLVLVVQTSDGAKGGEGRGAGGITRTEPNGSAPALSRARQLNGEGRTGRLDIHSNLEARRSSFS